MSQKQRMRAFRSAWHTSNQRTLHMLKGRGRERQSEGEGEMAACHCEPTDITPKSSSWAQLRPILGCSPSPPPQPRPPASQLEESQHVEEDFWGLICIVASFSAPSSSLCWGIIHCPRRHGKTTTTKNAYPGGLRRRKKKPDIVQNKWTIVCISYTRWHTSMPCVCTHKQSLICLLIVYYTEQHGYLGVTAKPKDPAAKWSFSTWTTTLGGEK